MKMSKYREHQHEQQENNNEMVRFVIECDENWNWRCHVVVDGVYDRAFNGVLKPCAEKMAQNICDCLRVNVEDGLEKSKKEVRK